MRTRGFRDPRLREIRLPVDHLERPLRVVQLSDLHVGMVTPLGLIRRAIELSNEVAPDLVVLTGDFVCRSTRYLTQLSETLSLLRGPRLAVLGNHDHWADGPAVRRALERAAVQVLQNENVALRGTGLKVVGMDDSTTSRHDPERAVQGLEGAALGLTHNPSAAPLLWERGVSTVLSGHTHGGQVHVSRVTPMLFERLGQRYVAGLYQEERHRVYVSAGVGSSALPWRGGAPARREVTLIHLAPASERP
jgi:predicted MPP superfamily phosphohydrolase